jgi:hypothetical protein
MNLKSPHLSIVIRVVGGGAFLERCLLNLLPQTRDQNIEIIVPYDATIAEIKTLAPRFPQVVFQEMRAVPSIAAVSPGARHHLYDRRSTAGFHAARGEIICQLEDYAIPNPDWCAQIIHAHRELEHAVIGGAVEHAGQGALNWALYFLDFGRYQLPLREGAVAFLTDVNVSYKRRALEMVREHWAERYNEVNVHWALLAKNVTLWQRPQIVVHEDRGTLSFTRALQERYEWGRVFGSMRAREVSLARRVFLIVASPLLPRVLVWRIAYRVMTTRRHRRAFLRALPFALLMAAAWSLGEAAAYLTGREMASPALAHSFENT